MSQNDPTHPPQADPKSAQAPLPVEVQLEQLQTKEEWDIFFRKFTDANRRQMEKIAPWLNEFGSWIFGGLIAFSILIIQGLILLGPIDTAIVVSSVAFAAALPLDVAGLIMLRLITDLKEYTFEGNMINAFQEAGFPMQGDDLKTDAIEKRRRERATSVLSISLLILILSGLLTLIGMAAGLWHITWWIGVVFIVMTLISTNIVLFSMLLNRPQRDARTKEAREHWENIDPQQRVDWQKHYREWVAQQKQESEQKRQNKKA